MAIGKQFTVSGLTGTGKATGDLVFAGYGITVKDGYDDYKDIDVKGKVVMVLRQTPRTGNKEKPFPDAMSHAPLDVKIANAEAHHAAGIIFINDKGQSGGKMIR